MPRRISIHNATSPHTSSNAVNEVINVLSRKLNSQHIDSPTVTNPAVVRRQPFKMDHLLHVKKDKKRDASKDRDSKKDKRGSLRIGSASNSRQTSRRGSFAAPAQAQVPSGSFEMIMESPPAMLHGSPTYSSGALISGRLKFNVEDPVGEVTLTDFTMVLQISTTTKKPIHKDCAECATKHEVVKEWKFLTAPKLYSKERDNQFPWSCMLEGRFPATTKCQMGSVSYSFDVTATTLGGQKITFSHPLQVRRAIPPGLDKASIRIFPPTQLTGRVTMPQIVHPIGTFPVSMSLSGIVEKKETSQTRWRLKKMMWRIEENSKVKSTPCEKHKGKLSEGKAIQHADSKTLGNDDVKTGWKTDFDTHGGEIVLEFEASVATKASHKVTCDVDSQSGLEVKHNLVVELIVAEEFVPNKNSQLITPTGAARVLRMQFALIVSERAGMGISWDDEMPPMYEDVPPSPPGYGSADKNDGAFGGAIMEDYEGPELEYTDLVRVPTTNPSEPPIYLERDVAHATNVLPVRTRAWSNDSNGAGPSQVRQRLGGFRLDELEAEPDFAPRRRTSAESDEEAEPDIGEGTAN